MTNPISAVSGYRTFLVTIVAMAAGALQIVGIGLSQSTQAGLVMIALAVLAAYFRLKAKHIFVGGISFQKVAVAVDTLLPPPDPPPWTPPVYYPVKGTLSEPPPSSGTSTISVVTPVTSNATATFIPGGGVTPDAGVIKTAPPGG